MSFRKIGIILQILVAVIAAIVAVAHMSCLYFGEACFRAQGAPESIIQSAKIGSKLAPVATVSVSLIFLICALYALSGANIIRRLPFLKLAIYSISTVCVIRGIVILPLGLISPQIFTPFNIIAGIVWFLSGACLLLGFLIVNRRNDSKQSCKNSTM